MWRFACTGTIEGVRAELQAATCPPEPVSFARVRECLLGELESVPTNGVMVEIEYDGHRLHILLEDVPLVLTEAKRPPKNLETISADAPTASLEFAASHLRGNGAAVRPAVKTPVRPLDRQEGT